MTILPALTFGLVLGMRHATDADHVAAMSTIVVSGHSARRAASLGALWGLGHSVSVVLVGGALVMMRLTMPARVALALEFLVALMLIVLGARALLHSRRASAPSSWNRPVVIGVVH